jgi:ATP-binding cassette subfamily F protein uup
LGRNGAGKTTFLRILSGQIPPDAGQVVLAPGAKVSLLTQDVPQHLTGTIDEVVAQAAAGRGDHDAAWQAEQRINRVLSNMELREKVISKSFVGNEAPRALAQARLDPDLLLLDEPTNYLDSTPSSGSKTFWLGGTRR